ncbi:Uncharacterised protein [Shigella sonnei]|nr:Uncharacterised protein [Shigella sonnei]
MKQMKGNILTVISLIPDINTPLLMRRLLSAAYRIQQEPYRLLSKICFKKITMVLLHYFMARVSFMAHLIMLQLKLHN